MVERLHGMQEVTGSSPVFSTILILTGFTAVIDIDLVCALDGIPASVLVIVSAVDTAPAVSQILKDVAAG